VFQPCAGGMRTCLREGFRVRFHAALFLQRSAAQAGANGSVDAGPGPACLGVVEIEVGGAVAPYKFGRIFSGVNSGPVVHDNTCRMGMTQTISLVWRQTILRQVLSNRSTAGVFFWSPTIIEWAEVNLATRALAAATSANK